MCESTNQGSSTPAIAAVPRVVVDRSLGSQWYVTQTNAGQERVAGAAIAKLKVCDEIWLPTFSRMTSHARRQEQVIRPLFPLYLFTRFDVAAGEYGAILRAAGVQTILGLNRSTGILPLPVPKTVIDDLRASAEATGGHVELESGPPPRLAKGTEVIITDGPFEYWKGLVDRDHHRRVRVLLDILGRQTPIVVPRESLATIS